MNRDELEELAALRALDLLEGEDLRRLQKELLENEEAVEVLSQFEATADCVSFTAEPMEVPSELENRIFANLPEQEVRPRVLRPEEADAETLTPRSKLDLGSWLPWALAAVLAVACAALWMDRVEQRGLLAERDSRISALESEGALDNLRIAVLRSKLESQPDAQAVAVWDEELQRGRLAVSDLPPVPPGKEYQLWIIDPNYSSPVSAGVFNTGDEGSSSYAFRSASSVDAIDAFALSIEEEGGSATPQGPIVLASE